MDPTTPVLPTVIITHPTPLPPVPRRTASAPQSHGDAPRSPSMASAYISSFFPSDPAGAGSSSTTRRTPLAAGEKTTLDHGLLSPYHPYTPARRRRTKRHQTAVQVGLLLLATLLLWTSTRWTDEWAGKGVMGLLLPTGAGLPPALGGSILDAWRGDEAAFDDGAPLDDARGGAPDGTPEILVELQEEPAAQAGKLGAMKVDEWKAYLASQQSMTGYPGPAATMEAWDFH